MKKYLFIVLLVGVWSCQKTVHSEKIISKWDNGNNNKVEYYEGEGFDKELVGVKAYYPNGDIRLKCDYSNNMRHGEALFYALNNRLLLKVDYIEGELQRSKTIYYPELIENYDGKNWDITKSRFFVIVPINDDGKIESYTYSIT